MTRSLPLGPPRPTAAALVVLLVLVAAYGGGCTATCDPSSACCTGSGRLAGTEHACGEWTEMSCVAACEHDAYLRQAVQYCSGVSPECNGRVERADWELSEGECEGLTTCIDGIPGGARCDCDLQRCLHAPQSCGGTTLSCEFEACADECCGQPDDGCLGTTCSAVAPVSTSFSTLARGTPKNLLGLDDGSIAVATCPAPGADCILERHDQTGTLLWQHVLPGPLPSTVVADRAGTMLASVGYAGCAQISPLGPDGSATWVRTLCPDASCTRGWGSDDIHLAAGADGSVVALALLPPCAASVDRGDGTSIDPPARQFLARWSAAGVLDWAVPVLDGAAAEGRVLESLDDGGVVVVGFNADGAVLAAGTPGETTLGAGLFVARFDAQGALSWARSAVRSTTWASLVGAASAPDGTVVLVASLQDPGSAAPDEASPIALPAGRALVGVRPDGSVAWAHAWAPPPNWANASPEGIAHDGGFVVVVSAEAEPPSWGSLNWSPPRPAVVVAELDDTGALASHVLVVEGAQSPAIGAQGRRLIVGGLSSSWAYPPYVPGVGIGADAGFGVVVVREVAP